MFFLAAAAVGLATRFAVSSLAFSVAKYAGAAYLGYLGVSALRAAPASASSDASVAGTQPGKASLSRVFRDGPIVALLNPKTALFFAAFLLQVIGRETSPMLQSIVLGALFVLIAAGTDCIYALAAGTLAPLLMKARRTQRIGRFFSGRGGCLRDAA